MKYTPEQRNAVESVTLDTVVTAGAGAGKTKVLVDRILHILETGLAGVDEIVAITYTIKAAVEIRERLRKKLKEKPKFRGALERLGTAYIGTLHSFCLRILQENPVLAQIDPDAQVLAEHRASAMISDSIMEGILENLDNQEVYDITREMGIDRLAEELRGILISRRNLGLNPFPPEEDGSPEMVISLLLYKGFKIYQDKKRELGVIDFEDILQKTRDLLEGSPGVLKYYNNKIKYIMVDEYQDLNFIQDDILRRLGETPNLFVVGDKKQSIYGFRGARVELFEKLNADIRKKGLHVGMEVNFRSDENILHFVNKNFEKIMADYEEITVPEGEFKNIHRGLKMIKNVRFLMPPAEGNMAERRRGEGDIIADKILEMTEKGAQVFDPVTSSYRNVAFGDFAVLLRRKTHVSAYTKALDQCQIPYVVAVGGSITENPGVKRILQALKVAASGDVISLYGVLTGLFGVSDEVLSDFVRDRGSLMEGITTEEKVPEHFECIRRWRNVSETQTLKGLFDIILKDTGILGKSGIQDIDMIMKLSDLVEEADEAGLSLEDFLGEIKTLGTEAFGQSSGDESGDCVKIITIHSAKGLEFPVVFVADTSSEPPGKNGKILFDPEAGLGIKDHGAGWERVKSVLDKREMNEAQRLLYVAVTRARDYLFICGEDKEPKSYSFLQWLKPFIDDTTPVETDVVAPPPKIFTAKKPSVSKIAPFCTFHGVPVSAVPATALGEYHRCPRRYYLGRVLGITEDVFCGPEKRTNIALKPGLTGAQRGSAVHRLIESSLKGEFNLKKIVRDGNLPGLKDITREDRKYIMRCLENYIRGDYFEGSKKILSEIPFLYRPDKSIYISGVADGIGIRDDGAIIADFKTNYMIKDSLMTSYVHQLKIYALAFNDIFKKPVKKAGIASLYEGIWYDIDISPDSLAKCRQELLDLYKRLTTSLKSNDFPAEGNCEICGYKDKICKGFTEIPSN